MASDVGPIRMLTIRLWQRETECIVCHAPLLDCRRAIPACEDEALPDDWDGEWAGFDACDPCADAQYRITEPTPFHKLREVSDG